MILTCFLPCCSTLSDEVVSYLMNFHKEMRHYNRTYRETLTWGSNENSFKVSRPQIGKVCTVQV